MPQTAETESQAATTARPRSRQISRSSFKAPRPSPFERGKLQLKLWDRIVFILMLTLIFGLSVVPDFLLYPAGIACGWLGYVFDRRHVRIGLKNLTIAFPEKTEHERRQILRASYINLGRAGAEYVRLGGFFYRRLKRRVTYDRIEYWNELEQRYPGRGILVMSAHFGNFELLHTGHALNGFQISLVHHTQRFIAGDALMSWIRERAGVDILRKHSAARAALKALTEGKLVGIPFDQNAKRSEAIFVPFFGEPAATASGLARLVRMSNAIVVPAFIIRGSDKRSHLIEIQDEIPLQRTGDEAADTLENTRLFVHAIEAIVRRYPEQFLWIHRRFRTRPRGMPPIYDN
ncbi:MAG: lysophospholipid acyltransferase family protein [Candidatus Binataceae bacterium]